MDVLDDILDTLDLHGVLYFRTDFSPPWGVTVPDLAQAARFHLLVEGNCHVRFASGQSLDLAAGDLLLVPRGRSHALSDAPRRRAPPLEQVLSEAGYDGQSVLVLGHESARAAAGTATRMLCGHLSFRQGADHPILRALPDYLLTTAADRARDPWLDELLTLTTRRVFDSDLASGAAVTRLSEVVFMELLRHGIHRSPRLGLLLQAVHDRYVGHALQLIHTAPEQPWTVATLAARVGMSRSRFAGRFRELTGMGPMRYLSDWRLQKALALLCEPRTSIQQVASRIGYESPAAFARAFSVRFGLPPTEYRRRLA